ncbi:MAG: hypothetical protein CBR30_05610 [Dictyoglomus sp. NZ13-RE01]|nr:MAG: hypothetical protein CBR30_05610 [Dictyoglomus sp. NZ13-RE01]
MKKLVYLLVLALLVVPAFAAITVTTSASGSLSFKSQLSPWPVTFVPSASLSLKFSLSGDNKTVGNIVAEIDAVSDVSSVSVTTEDITYVTDVTYTVTTYTDSSGNTYTGAIPVVHTATKTVVTNVNNSFTTTGRLTFKGIAGLVDLSLNRGTLSVGGTNLVKQPLKRQDGIGVVVNAPVKVTVGYKPDQTDALTYTKGVFAVRADGSFAPVTFYGLFVSDHGTNSYAFGASATPVSMVSVFGEYASVAPNWIVGGTLTPVSGVSLYGQYKGDKTYKVSATVTTIPNVTLYGEYTGKFFGYGTVSKGLPVGTLSAGAGYDTAKADFALFAKLVTPVGPANNEFRVYKNYDITDADGDGVYWYDNVAPTDFRVENVISVSF